MAFILHCVAHVFVNVVSYKIIYISELKGMDF